MKTSRRFWIYILECEDGSYYTGYTRNLVRRYRQHVEGLANVRYTSTRRPIRIAQCWRFSGDVGTALRIESCIKRSGRPLKDALVRDPKRLSRLIRDRLDLRKRIQHFSPDAVERESRRLEVRALKTAPDPFD